MREPTPSPLVWHKVLDDGELPDGRVKAVTCGHRTLCMTRDGAAYGGLGVRVTEAGELEGALERALAHDGSSLVEIETDAELV